MFLAIIILFLPLGFYIFNYVFYDYLYTSNNVYETLDKQDVELMTYKVFDFFKYRGDLEGQVRLMDPDPSFIPSFSDNEVSHMKDVRELLTNIFTLFMISLALFTALFLMTIFLNRNNSLTRTGLVFIWSSSAALFLYILLLILSINFSSLFDNFHLVFFPQGNYMFPEGSLLITMFPFGFFYQFFIRLGVSSSAIAVFMLIIGIAFVLIGKKARK